MKKAFSRALALVLCLCLACGALSACSEISELASGVPTGEFPVDVAGVTIGSKPQRVLVLSPSLADVVLALGCETQLAASSEDCVQDSLRDLAKVDPSQLEGSGINPDLILLDPASASQESFLRDAGFTVLNIAPATDRVDYERLYAQVSSALNGGGPGNDQGIATAQDIFLTLDEIVRVVPNDRVTTACYLYDLEGAAVTGDMFGSTIMTYSGVTNIFKSLTGGQYEFDSLTMSDPDLIFCVPGLKEELENDSRFADLQAVQDGKIVELDAKLMEWQGRTIVECALEISAAAFPELTQRQSTEVSDPAEGINSAVSSALESSRLEEDGAVYETLQEGDQGDQVLAMQSRLDELGYLDTDYDGHFGEYTASCLRDFQRENGLEETGVADQDTQRKLFSRSAVAKGGTSPSPEASPSVSPEPESSSEPEGEG